VQAGVDRSWASEQAKERAAGDGVGRPTGASRASARRRAGERARAAERVRTAGARLSERAAER
jgi:hypothetical protein